MSLSVFWRRIVVALLVGLGAVHGARVAHAAALPAPEDEAALFENAKKEGTVVWYSGGPLETTKAMAARFMEKYPGVNVEVLRLTGAQMYQRFMQETAAGQYIADILWLSDQPSVVALIDQKLLADWKIPTSGRFPVQYKMGDKAYAFNRADIAIAYNETKLTEEEVTLLRADWKNILDPRFKGRFASTTSRCGVCYAPINMFMDPAKRAYFGEDFLEKVAAQKPAVYGDFVAMIDRVIAGERDFAFWSFESIAATKRAQGAPLRWIYPKPTPSFPSTWMSVPIHAPHPNAARLFINWMGSEAGATSIQLDYFGATTIEGVGNLKSFAKEPWYQPPAELYSVDFDRWNSDYERDMNRWTAALKGSM